MVVKIAIPLVGSHDITILVSLSVLVSMEELAGVESSESPRRIVGSPGIAASVEPGIREEKATTRLPL